MVRLCEIGLLSHFPFPRSPMTHTSRVPLRWSDLDALGHINNAVYLTLCEQGRTEAFEALLPAGWAGEESPVLAAASLTFRRPITHTGVAVVETTFTAPGRTSVRTRTRVSLEGDGGGVCAEVECVLVWIDVAAGRPVPIPPEIRAAAGAAAEAAEPA